MNLCPLQCKLGVLTTGPPGKSPGCPNLTQHHHDLQSGTGARSILEAWEQGPSPGETTTSGSSPIKWKRLVLPPSRAWWGWEEMRTGKPQAPEGQGHLLCQRVLLSCPDSLPQGDWPPPLHSGSGGLPRQDHCCPPPRWGGGTTPG